MHANVTGIYVIVCLIGDVTGMSALLKLCCAVRSLKDAGIDRKLEAKAKQPISSFRYLFRRDMSG